MGVENLKKLGLVTFLLVLLFSNVYVSASSLGSKGSEVKEVQVCIKAEGYYFGKIDGIFGRGTMEGVKKLQKSKGLSADGVVGKETLKAVRKINKDNIYLLSKIINGEARGESKKEMVTLVKAICSGYGDFFIFP